MSTDAPWLALSVDWMDSEMFDGATDAERLAWIALLCHAKKNGRAGKVRVRKSALARDYSLSARGVEGMLARAQKCGAIETDGDSVFVVNWRIYQQKAYRNKEPENSQNGFSAENRATHHTSPSTHHTSPSTDTPQTPAADAAPPSGGDRAKSGKGSRYDYTPEFEAAWSAYGKDRGEKATAFREYTQAIREIRKRADAPENAHAWLLARIEAFQASKADTERRFVPHMHKWLKGGGFDTDLTPREAVDPRFAEIDRMYAAKEQR